MKIITNKLLHILFLVLLSSLFTNAQERISIKKSEFKLSGEDASSSTTDFNTAWKSIKAANFLVYQNKKGSYRKATQLYKLATEYNSHNPELNLQLGICYLNSWPKENALEVIKKAIEAKEDVHPKAKYYLARAYHLAGKYNEAISEYEAYLETRNKKQEKAEINRYIEQCKNALKIVNEKFNVLVINAGDINSEFDDYTPIFDMKNFKLYFTTRRGKKGDKINTLDDQYFEDIYESALLDRKFAEAINIGKPINKTYNDAVVNISNDGNEMVFYRGSKGEGNLYLAKLKNGKWSNIKSFTGKINDKKSHESYVCFSEGGTKMFFVSSNKHGSIGGKDIFMSELKNKKHNTWKKPVNLGNKINTPYDEVSVTVSSDGQTLYFCSNGHNSIGGYDVFKSEFKNGEWSEPVNMGLPINSPADEIHFTVLENGRDAYYASSRKEGKGGFDIYHAIMIGEPKPILLCAEDNIMVTDERVETLMEEPAKIKYTKMTVVKGLITDYNTKKPLKASIELVDNATGKKVNTTYSDEATGAYLIALPSGKNYGFSVNANGYMFQSENFIVPKASGHKEIFKDVALQPMTAGSKIILQNTFFDTGKSSLRSESFSELDRLTEMFAKYPKLVLEISGHTDNRGSASSNKRLSRARAKSVVNYLISKGVKESSLKAVGYYFKYPIASNRTKEGRQQNRRVEVKIISNE